MPELAGKKPGKGAQDGHSGGADGRGPETRRVLKASVAFGVGALAMAAACGDGGGGNPAAPGPAGGMDQIRGAFADSALGIAVAEALRVTDLPVDSAHLDCLTTLTARERGIVGLEGIGGLRRLRSLDLSHNAISDLQPLAYLDSLRFLDLSFNAVEDLSPLRHLRALRVVALEHNLVTDVTALVALDSLTDAALTGNRLSEPELRRLEASGIRVTFHSESEFAPEDELGNPSTAEQGVFRFVFSGYAPVGNRRVLWVASTDLSEPKPLFDDYGSDYTNYRWAPDGRRFLYVTNRGDAVGQYYRLFVASASSLEGEAVTEWFTHWYAFAWSPDGSRIAFTEGRGSDYGRIGVMDADGGALRWLTEPGAARDGYATWSPDGGRIAFDRVADPQYPDSSGLRMVDLDTGRVTRLDGGSGSGPTWSPVDDRIAYIRWDSIVGYELRVVEGRRGATPTVLFAGESLTYDPQWSRDGQRIVFVSKHDVPETQGFFGNIYMVDVDGSGVMKLTESGAIYRGPSFSPDGQLIGYQSDKSGVLSIHVQSADGAGGDLNMTAGAVRLPNFVGSTVYWQPQ